MTKHLTSQEVQAEEEKMKKGNAEADGMDREPKVVIAGSKYESGIRNLNSVEMFSLSTGTWTPLQPTRERHLGASSVVYNNQIFVIGGFVKSIEKLSMNAVQGDQSITWEKYPVELPGDLYGHCSVVHNGRLIIFGGFDPNKAECSDSITEISLVPPYTSKLLATMPQTRCDHGVAIFGDKIAIFGGVEAFSFHGAIILKTVIMYDITKNECKELAPLPYHLSQMATVKWGDDNVIIVGGNSLGNTLNKVLMYNIKTQRLSILPDMKNKRKGCVAAVVRDTVIVMGGKNERDKVLKSVESFSFDRNSWEELPEMHEQRWGAAAVAC